MCVLISVHEIRKINVHQKLSPVTSQHTREKAIISQSSPLIHFDFRSGSDKGGGGGSASAYPALK